MCEGHDHTNRILVEKRALAANDREAAHLRGHFRDDGTLVLNLISSPGSGKTTLLERTVRLIGNLFHLGAIEGDIATERDADRLRRLGIPARQILTGGACHLDAGMVHDAIHDPFLAERDILFIENVGNLVCPASYDLGEDFKVALLSVAEGDDKPFKYPGIFSQAAVTVIAKADLLPYVSFDLKVVRDELSALNPAGEILVTSARTGQGMGEWCAMLQHRLEAKRASVSTTA